MYLFQLWNGKWIIFQETICMWSSALVFVLRRPKGQHLDMLAVECTYVGDEERGERELILGYGRSSGGID